MSDVVELAPEDPRATVCGHCHRGWDDTVSTSVTPTPSGRCPFEYEHEYPEEDKMDEEIRVAFTPQAVTQIMNMQAAARRLRSFYGPHHDVTIEAQSSLLNSLVALLGLGGTIYADGDMAVGGTNQFGFTFGLVAHKRGVAPEIIELGIEDAPAPLSFSVNS